MKTTKPVLSIYVLICLIIPAFCPGQIKLTVSPNFLDLLEKVPYVTEKAIAKEIRYIYASAKDLEDKKKPEEPFVVTNEEKEYQPQTTPGTEWNDLLESQAQAIDRSHQDFMDKYEDQLTLTEMEGYMAMNQSVQTSIAALQTYLSVMGALSSLAVAWAEKDAGRLVDWTQEKTKCIGQEAKEGSILHLEIMWLVKGRSFKFHSESDIRVTATLETGDGRWITSKQMLQMWVDTKKVTVSPDNSIPYHENLTDEDKDDLDPLIKKSGILTLQAILINAAVEDLDMRLKALEEIGREE